MRTTVVTSLALGAALAWGSPLPALGQGAPQAEVPVACFIPYGNIEGIEVFRDEVLETGETVLDGPGQSGLLQAIGTPSDPDSEKLRLTCRDQVDPPGRPQRATGFPCDVFRGHRGGSAEFETTEDTRIQVDGDGAVIMRCTTE